MLKSEEKIRKKIERYQGLREYTFESLEEGRVPEENIPKVYLSAGSKGQKIGLYKLALGSCVEAVPDFQMSAEWYYKGARETRQRRESLSDDFEGGMRLLKYLYSAILSGDDALLEQATEIAFETHESHYHQFSTVHRYHLMNALAATVQETGDQQHHLDELEATLDDLPDDHPQYFGALWQALTGVVDRDEQAFEDGIAQFLEWHDDNVDFENKTSADDLVCLPVLTLVVLARRDGMDVSVDSPYVPDCVDDLV
ncbi:immunity 49 family protein [Natronobeatus ordinarius]|uniref:immunity 49 family protein n=1 Tax=Natronobeatus ordinarius TaxID=2963433 RepID=UPI0020CEE709|nr:immunity 49 family protein [Natronobeatus ordinarius]